MARYAARMAGSPSKRRSRKRRTSGAQPRAVPSTRREERESKLAAGERQAIAARRAAVGRDDRRRPGTFGTLGTVGERPAGLFGGFPLSGIAIAAGLIGVVVGFAQNGGAALTVGIVACGLGVLELTAREHLSGFRSHTTLLAAVPAVLVEVALVSTIGQPRQHLVILVPVIPIFLISFWLLRRQFVGARQRRSVRL